MERKLLFFDIDGTLLCGGLPGYIPESTLAALKGTQKRGHYVFINTGRAWSYLPQAIKAYPFDGYICGCGTYVRFHDQVLYHHVIPDSVRQLLLQALKQCRVQGLLEGTDRLYVDYDIDPFPPIERICDSYTVYSNKEAAGFQDDNLSFEKFVIIGNESGDHETFLEKTRSYFDSFGKINLGDWYFEEFVPRTCSKATGIDVITDHLHLSADDCYVFGDGNNDISMMKHVKYSIAMGNSSEKALAAATYVTTPADRDGIRNAMVHYGLI